MWTSWGPVGDEDGGGWIKIMEGLKYLVRDWVVSHLVSSAELFSFKQEGNYNQICILKRVFLQNCGEKMNKDRLEVER